MKLVTVLMLTALPLYCYAGSGCQALEKLAAMVIDRKVSVDEVIKTYQEYIPGEESKKALIFLKQGFLHQSEETLKTFAEMQQAIYSSFWCARY